MYEYYVHQKGEDKRVDRWVTEKQIHIDEDEIRHQEDALTKSELKKKQQANDTSRKWYNDPNLGYNEKQVKDFEKNCKIKNVESI